MKHLKTDNLLSAVLLIPEHLKLVLLLVYALSISGCGSDTLKDLDGLYETQTADGVTLKMKRYRPTTDESFNNTQPILLFPGMLANMNEFQIHTPENRKQLYSGMSLPDQSAEWALNDEFIFEDPLKYYSWVHYFWNQGYDPWLVNYRGLGRGAFKSDPGIALSNLDILAALDAPAAIEKVEEITGMSPIIGGHSTGGFVSYAYLQGITLDVDVILNEGYIPHVVSDPELAQSRNEKIPGFIGIDPAGQVPIAFGFVVDSTFFWSGISYPLLIDFDFLLGELLIPLFPSELTISALELFFGTIDFINRLIPDAFDAINAFNNVDFWTISKTNEFVEDFVARNALSGFYSGMISGYADWGINYTHREYWRNGEENRDRNYAPDPAKDDGYYYYNQNMYLISVPAISVFSEKPSLVDTETMLETFYDGKTNHLYDEWFELKDAGHIDIAFSDDVPTDVFPRVGVWLRKVAPLN